MKTLEQAYEVVKSWEGAWDGRDKSRFARFVPFEDCPKAGLEPNDGIDATSWGDVVPWTEEKILEQLKDDVLFGYEKATGQRGLSANCMFYVVNMWCILLENGLEEDSYSNYGVEFFQKVATHYGWEKELQ